MSSLINKSVLRDMQLVRDCMLESRDAARAGKLYLAGQAMAAARDGCAATAERIGSLADALDRGEYHNGRLTRLRCLELKLSTLRVTTAMRVMQIETAIKQQAA